MFFCLNTKYLFFLCFKFLLSNYAVIVKLFQFFKDFIYVALGMFFVIFMHFFW